MAKSKHRKHESRTLSSSEKKLQKSSLKLTKKHKDENPFENYKQKRKFNTLGTKQQVVKLSEARSKGIKTRKETLLVDFYNRSKANEFIDERTDDSQNKKILMSLKRQKGKQKKKSLFSLEDDDVVLDSEHLGDDGKLHDDYQEDADDLMEDELNTKTKKRKREESNDTTTIEPPPKKKKDVMKDIIKKSKKEKYIQKTKNAAVKLLTHQLDEEFSKLGNLLRKNEKKKEKELDEFDQLTKQLSMAPRAKSVVTPQKPKSEEKKAKENTEVKNEENVEDLDNLGYDIDPEFMPEAEEDAEDGEFELDDEENKENEISDSDSDEKLEKSENIQKTEETSKEGSIPSSFEEFSQLFAEKSADQLTSTLRNILALVSNNNEKKEAIFAYIMRYFYNVTELPTINFKIIDILSEQVYNLSQTMPDLAVKLFSSQLKKIQSQLEGKELHIGFPGMSELLFLKLISNVFSVSDNHVIITPAIIYMCQCLSNCTIETCKDVGAGIFLCSLLLHYTRETKKIVPEVIAYLTDLLETVSFDENSKKKSMLRSKKHDWLHIPEKERTLLENTSIEPISFPAIMQKNTTFTSSIKMSLINGVFSILEQFSELNKHVVGFPEFYSPVLAVLEKIQSSLPKPLITKHQSLVEQCKQISNQVINSRKPLQLLKVKPVAIEQLEPMIYNEKEFKGKILDPNKQRLQQRILRKKIKREQRAAIREIRKDNRFLRIAREQEREREEQKRKEKYKEIIHQLQEQEHMHAQLDFGNRELKRQRKKMRKQRKEKSAAQNMKTKSIFD